MTYPYAPDMEHSIRAPTSRPVQVYRQPNFGYVVRTHPTFGWQYLPHRIEPLNKETAALINKVLNERCDVEEGAKGTRDLLTRAEETVRSGGLVHADFDEFLHCAWNYSESTDRRIAAFVSASFENAAKKESITHLARGRADITVGVYGKYHVFGWGGYVGPLPCANHFDQRMMEQWATTPRGMLIKRMLGIVRVGNLLPFGSSALLQAFVECGGYNADVEEILRTSVSLASTTSRMSGALAPEVGGPVRFPSLDSTVPSWPECGTTSLRAADIATLRSDMPGHDQKSIKKYTNRATQQETTAMGNQMTAEASSIWAAMAATGKKEAANGAWQAAAHHAVKFMREPTLAYMKDKVGAPTAKFMMKFLDTDIGEAAFAYALGGAISGVSIAAPEFANNPKIARLAKELRTFGAYRVSFILMEILAGPVRSMLTTLVATLPAVEEKPKEES